jgi:hypothetical protein
MTDQEQTERGTVESSNDKGIKVNGRWLNYSQFRQLARPQVGDTVELEVVRDRFINALTLIGVDGEPIANDDASVGPPVSLRGGGLPPPRPVSSASGPPPWDDSFAGIDAPPVAGGPGAVTRSARPAAPAGRAPAPARAVLTPEERAQDRRERRRLACLAAAAQFFAPRAAATIDDVIDATRVLELFVVEPPEASVSPAEPVEDMELTGLSSGAGGDETPF